jgi:hypothetical protein
MRAMPNTSAAGSPRVSRGVVYVATGDPAYALYAACSILSLRDTGYRGPITVFTDMPAQRFRLPGVRVAKIAVPKDARKPSRALKTSLAALSPYSETLFLDADTVVLEPVQKIWSFLKKSDIALALDRNPALGTVNHATPEELRRTLSMLPASTPHYNSGVMVWKKSSKTLALFNAWNAEWNVFSDIDQLALCRAIAKTGITSAILPEKYNLAAVRAHSAEPAIIHFGEQKKRIPKNYPALFKRACAALNISRFRASLWLARSAFKRFARRVLRKT